MKREKKYIKYQEKLREKKINHKFIENLDSERIELDNKITEKKLKNSEFNREMVINK